MDIIVLIKQVPATGDVKIDPKHGTLIREGIPSIVNPDDLHSIEEGLRLCDKQVGGSPLFTTPQKDRKEGDTQCLQLPKDRGKVTAISMGPPQAIDALQEVIAMGIDECILLTDFAFAGADTLATAYTLGRCVEKLGKYDLIICGMQAIDGDTGQVGPQVAEYLDIPQITYVRKIEIAGNKLIAERVIENGYEKIECKLPALITVVKELNKPGYPTIQGIIDVCSESVNIKIWNAGDIGAMADRTGLIGSPTKVKQTFTPEHKRKGEILSGDKDTIAKALLDKLKGKKII